LSNTFFFVIFCQGLAQGQANSAFFNITEAVSQPISSSSSSSSSSASSTSLTSVTSIPANAASSTPPHAEKSGLTTGAKIGLGVGIVAAVLLISGAGWFLFALGRKAAARKAEEEETASSTKAMAVTEYPPEQQQQHYIEGSYQLDAEPNPKPSMFELPAGRYPPNA
jgi:hypothetical protein